MFRDAASFDNSACVLVLGPGMGDSARPMRGFSARARIDSAAPLVIDADALNLIAASPDLQAPLAKRSARGG
jgi:NAD(P)H-hydrate repair Nnr-like enzyme with NAD(P)H-hydrate dehydratase domain